MKGHHIIIIGFLLFLPLMNLGCRTNESLMERQENVNNSSRHIGTIINLADPTIFEDQGTYYLYGTSSDEGFLVYSSTDLYEWEGPMGANAGGLCLSKGESFGTKGFWAPQVFKNRGKYYMVYVANEQLAIATSDSPKGPFKQSTLSHIPAQTKEIDPFILFDDDGKIYMFHDRLINGNHIYVAEMDSDLKALKEETAKECISISESWENAEKNSWSVIEGPAVIKLNGIYYLFYSANDFRSKDYAVGFATAPSPYGPWTKHKGPIINWRNIGQYGTGHGDIVRDNKGNWLYVFHTHNSIKTVNPRKTGIVQLQKKGNDFLIARGTFRYLIAN